MKAYNILRVIFTLLVNEKTTVKRLSEELEVSTRTIKRYIQDIICLDLPIETTPGKNGGVFFNKKEFYEKNQVTNKELDFIIDTLCANSTLDSIFKGDSVDFSEILKKIKLNNIIEIDFSKWCKNTTNDINFSTIKHSISIKKQIEFDYYDMYNNHSHRIVEPYKIGFKEKNWYVLGFCHLRKEIRIFKISKIKNIALLEKNFSENRNADFDFHRYFTNKAKITLKMIVSKNAISKAYEDFETSEITETDNHLLITSTQIDNPNLISLVMSYGYYATVISPENIRRIIIENAKKIEKNYEGDNSCPIDKV